jgi:hypothetical protein
MIMKLRNQPYAPEVGASFHFGSKEEEKKLLCSLLVIHEISPKIAEVCQLDHNIMDICIGIEVYGALA